MPDSSVTLNLPMDGYCPCSDPCNPLDPVCDDCGRQFCGPGCLESHLAAPACECGYIIDDCSDRLRCHRCGETCCAECCEPVDGCWRCRIDFTDLASNPERISA